MSLVRFRFWARRCSSMVEHQPSKLNTWVRFPSPALKMNILFIMREWLSWWSTTLPRSGSRVRVPSRALFFARKKDIRMDILFFVKAEPDRALHPRAGIEVSAHVKWASVGAKPGTSNLVHCIAFNDNVWHRAK